MELSRAQAEKIAETVARNEGYVESPGEGETWTEALAYSGFSETDVNDQIRCYIEAYEEIKDTL